MLSRSIRIMRREIQDVFLASCGPIIITGEMAQSYVLSLILCEEAAMIMEEQLGYRAADPAPTAPSGVKIRFHPSNVNRPQLTVIDGNGDGAA